MGLRGMNTARDSGSETFLSYFLFFFTKIRRSDGHENPASSFKTENVKPHDFPLLFKTIITKLDGCESAKHAFILPKLDQHSLNGDGGSERSQKHQKEQKLMP